MQITAGKIGLNMLLAWVLLSNFSQAHPFHTTSAEMEFNSDTGRFEVALKIHASDFEHMIRDVQPQSSRDETSTSIPTNKQKQRETNLAKALTRYLEPRFAVALDGEPCRFEWVGMEDEQASKWLYFELVMPSHKPGSGQLTLTNKVLCDSNSGQINTLVFMSNSKRVSFKTHEHQMVVALPALD